MLDCDLRREIVHSEENEQMGFVLPSFDSSFLPVYNSTAVPTTAAAGSGLTFNDVGGGASSSRKRHRPVCFLGDDAYSVSSHLQQQMLDIDHLVVQHVIFVIILKLRFCVKVAIFDFLGDGRRRR